MTLLPILFPILGAALALALCLRARVPWLPANYATLVMLLQGFLSVGPPGVPAGLALFPYLRPGAIPAGDARPGFLGLPAYALAIVALLGQPVRRTFLPGILTAIGLAIGWTQRPGSGLPLSAAGTATLAAMGLALLTEGMEHRATRRQREALAVLTAVLGGLCFHVISLYLRGGDRPADAPTLPVAIAFSLASFAAALTPMLAMLVGAWSERRRSFAMLVAAASIAELSVVALGKLGAAAEG
ncbi:MAG: hypothetical protein U0166_10300 [Acidobacteriota bacterium]